MLTGVSGYEDAPRKSSWRGERFADHVYTTPAAMCWPSKKGRKRRKRVLLEAIWNEVGLVVSHIEENGFLLF